MFWSFGSKACGTLVPWPGVELAPPILEGDVLITGPPGKSPKLAVESAFYDSTPHPEWASLAIYLTTQAQEDGKIIHEWGARTRGLHFSKEKIISSQELTLCVFMFYHLFLTAI